MQVEAGSRDPLVNDFSGNLTEGWMFIPGALKFYEGPVCVFPLQIWSINSTLKVKSLHKKQAN